MKSLHLYLLIKIFSPTTATITSSTTPHSSTVPELKQQVILLVSFFLFDIIMLTDKVKM